MSADAKPSGEAMEIAVRFGPHTLGCFPTLKRRGCTCGARPDKALALAIDALVQRAVERERERCVKIVTGYGNEEFKRHYGVYSLIAALRATPPPGGAK